MQNGPLADKVWKFTPAKIKATNKVEIRSLVCLQVYFVPTACMHVFNLYSISRAARGH